MERQKWIEPGDVLAVSTQCKLLAVTRSVVYEQKKCPQKEVDELECILLNKLAAILIMAKIYPIPGLGGRTIRLSGV